MNTRKFAFVAAAVAALGLGTAAEGVAQVCTGTPTLNGQRALSLGAGFPDGATNYQARLDVNTVGPISGFGAYTRTSIDNIDYSVNTLAGGLAYSLTPVSTGRVALSVCPTAGVQYGMSSGGDVDQNQLVVPVGLGLGTRVDVGNGVAVAPYVHPEFYISRFSSAGTTTTDNGFRTTLGTALDFGPFFAGVDYTMHHVNGDVPVLDPAVDGQFGVRLGVKF